MVSDIRTRVDHKQRLQLAPQYRPSHKATNFIINIHSKFVIYIHSINSPHKYASDSLSPTCVTFPPSHAHHTHTKAAEETIAIYIYCRHIVCLCQTFLFFASPNIFSPKRFSCIFFFFWHRDCRRFFLLFIQTQYSSARLRMTSRSQITWAAHVNGVNNERIALWIEELKKKNNKPFIFIGFLFIISIGYGWWSWIRNNSARQNGKFVVRISNAMPFYRCCQMRWHIVLWSSFTYRTVCVAVTIRVAGQSDDILIRCTANMMYYWVIWWI